MKMTRTRTKGFNMEIRLLSFIFSLLFGRQQRDLPWRQELPDKSCSRSEQGLREYPISCNPKKSINDTVAAKALIESVQLTGQHAELWYYQNILLKRHS